MERLTDIITKTFEEVGDDFCNNYCKYPGMWDRGEIEHEEDEDLTDSDICSKCPLMKI